MDIPIELSVERLGAQGDGIAQYESEPVFLPFTVPGDRVLARLGKKRGGGREGRVLDRLVSGRGRANPPCRHFGSCGGCMLQHLDPAFYRAVKLEALRGALQRNGIDPAIVQPLRVVPPARRRARFGLARPRDPRLPSRAGFRQRFRHDLVDIAECSILEAPLFAVVGKLRPMINGLLSLGETAEAAITCTDTGNDLLIEAVERPGLRALEALAELAQDCDLARIVWRSPQEEILVVMRRPVQVLFSGVAVSFPPGGFLQASRVAEAILIGEVLAGVGGSGPVLDLFAGLGNFAFSLAQKGPVHAVEGDACAAAALAEAAAGCRQISVERRDLARDPLPPDYLSRYAAAVFDPPRAGAFRQAEALAASALERIVGVSCNPTTFARDAATLIAGGFRLEHVTPVDQFVWTPHLELAAVFRR